MSAFGGLDDTCQVCGGVVGEHTLRSFAVCQESRSTETPFHAVEGQSPLQAALEELRAKFMLPGDMIIADTVQVKGALMDGSSGPLRVRFPVVIHEFQVSLPTGPAPVASVAFMAMDAKGIRGYGRLVEQNANAAARALERGQ